MPPIQRLSRSVTVSSRRATGRDNSAPYAILYPDRKVAGRVPLVRWI